MNPRKIFAVALKEIRQIRRDPLTLFMLLGIPAFMLVVFGYAVNFDVENVPLGVVDRDHTAASRALVDAFVTSGRFALAGDFATEAEVAFALEKGTILLALVIPEDHGNDLAAGRRAPVQILLDGTDSNTATTALGYANGIVTNHNRDLTVTTLRRAGRESALQAGINFQPRVWYNPELDSSNFLVPGLIGFILMLTATLSTALSLVREAERGTLEQLRVAPLRSPEILIGKTLPYLVIALTSVVGILIAARLLFGVAVRGSYVDLFAITVLYLTAGFAWGLLISTIADSQAIAFQIGVMTSILPTLLLSGFIFPIHNMPLVLQLITRIVPARYYLVVLRGIILKGAGLAPYWDQIAALATFTFVILTLASVRFARKGTA